MSDVSSAIKNTVSITLFNKGMAGRIFESVREEGAKVVIKNNNPECVLLSPDEYIKLIDAYNDMKLLELAEERLKNADSKKLYSEEEVWKSLKVSDKDLENCPEAEIE